MVVTPHEYLLFYSGNAWDSSKYAVGYATCKEITGPCTRPADADTPWMASSRFASGPGGQEFFGAVGQIWMIYHGWKPGEAGTKGSPRRLYLDIVTVSGGIPRRVGARRAWTLLILLIAVFAACAGALVWWIHRRRRRRARQ